MSTEESDGLWHAPRSMLAPRSVYHFTDMRGLLGIVEHAELWATEASSLNDPTEVSGGLDRIYRWMRRHRTERAVAKVLEVLPNRPELFGRIYVLSASLDGDDAGQWRSYGDNGRGCAIELDTSRPLTVKAQQPLVRPAGWARRTTHASLVTRWTRTIYTEAQLDEVLRGLTSWAEREFTAAERIYWGSDDLAPSASVEYVMDALLAVAALLKPPGYHGEAEARTVVTLTRRSPHTRFRASAYGIAQYASLARSVDDPDATIHDGDRWTLPIRSIRLGPHASYELAHNTIRELLDRNGYVVAQAQPGHVRLRRSTTPMR